MDTGERIEQLLDLWEDSLQRDPDADAGEFVSRQCRGEPAEVARILLRRIEALRAMDRVLAPGEGGSAADWSGSGLGPRPGTGLCAGDEPVAGYRLDHRIAAGGFGEVWKATGPSDFPLAMKFVRLGGKGDAELKALRIARKARHPNLITTYGAWQRPGYLLIAMELADYSLDDRLHEAIGQGLPGIPGEELLGYLEDAAEGLDFLNDPGDGAAGIQHRDVKPQNLLVVGGRVKVADFGIARILRGEATGHTGHLSVAYAAPEFFEGRTSQHSDQYSLAVTYCQLRSGQLPFPGNQGQMMRGHTAGVPDLSALPEQQRPIVARALAKVPAERWPSCRQFVAALKAPAPWQPKPAWRGRRLWAGSAALVALAAGAVWLLADRHPDRRRPAAEGPEERPAVAATAAPEPGGPPADNLWQQLGRAVAEQRLAESQPAGRTSYGIRFLDQPGEPRYLAGLRLSTGKFGIGFRFIAIASIQPLYQTAGGMVEGETYGQVGSETTTLGVRPGYAVGKVLVSSHSRVKAVKLVLMRVTPQGLDPGDTYETDWYGQEPPEVWTTLGSGRPIVGIGGVWVKELRALQVIEAELK